MKFNGSPYHMTFLILKEQLGGLIFLYKYVETRVYLEIKWNKSAELNIVSIPVGYYTEEI